MLSTSRGILYLGFVILAGLPIALAHGSDDAANTSHSDHASMSMPNMEPMPDIPSYFSHPEHSGLMYAHIVLMVISWVILMPLAVMLSIARSRSTIVLQFSFLITNAMGIIASMLYNHQTPDLYQGDSHNKGAWAITWIAVAWCLKSFLLPYESDSTTSHEYSTLSTQPATQRTPEDEHDGIVDSSKFRPQRWSRDSGIASESSSRRSSEVHSPMRFMPLDEEQQSNHDECQEESLQTGRAIQDLLSTAFSFTYVLIERLMIPLGFVAFVTGIVAYSGIGRGNHVFNILAHLIKGSIFFGYGLLTFGRYLGAYPLFGWNWSLRPSPNARGRWTTKVPSAEFVESFVIWLYGVTNVGLEHLAAAGEPWTPMDFEHVGISMLFFGGGLLGMLIESSYIHRLLDRFVSEQQYNNNGEESVSSTRQHSLNPMPALTICLLGYIMSSHTQHSAVSGQIHSTFGLMFTVFSIARIATYITVWLKPPQGMIPSRPPTEVVTSFALVCGGLIFTLSNKDTVAALEAYKLDNLFVFTVTVSLSLVVMAWEVVLVAIRNGADGRRAGVTASTA